MVDYLKRFNDHVGLLQRLQQAVDAEKQGQWGGLQYGNIPVLGGALRPLGAAANAVGLGLEGLGTTGKAIAGEAALPFVYAESAFGAGNAQDQQRSQDLVNGGLGNLLVHPGRTMDSLRTSQNPVTSWLSGILEMASDPTNVLLAPLSAATKAEKAAKLAAVSGAGGKLAPEFFKGVADDAAKQVASEFTKQTAIEDSFIKFQSFLDKEMIRNASVEGGQKRVASLADQLATAKDATAGAKFALGEEQGYYKEARNAVADALKTARSEGRFRKAPQWLTDESGIKYPNPELPTIKAENEARRVKIRDSVLEQFPGGPKGGVTYKDYTADSYKAAQDAIAEERAIAAKYEQAVKEAPAPVKYDLQGNPLGKDKGLPNIGEINTSQAAGEIPQGYEMPIEGLPKDSPKAIAAGVGRVANAKPLSPTLTQLADAGNPGMHAIEDTAPFTSRMSSLIQTAFEQAKVAQRAGMENKNKMVGLSQVTSAWKGIATQTLRNIIMDEGFARVVTMDNGIRRSLFDSNKSFMINRLGEMGPDAAGMYEHPLAHIGGIADALGAMGYLKRLPRAEYDKVVEAFGVSPFDSETKNLRDMSAMQHLIANTIVGLANPARASVNLLTMPLGYLGPARQRMFHILNNVTHMAARGATFEQGFAPYAENSAKLLLRAAEGEGKDTSLLVGRGLLRDGEQVMSDGLFSPQEVGVILGPRYEQEWSRMLDEAVQAGFARSNDVLGNFSKRGPLEMTLDKFFPFMSWTWRAYPRMAKVALSHPFVTAGLIQLFEADYAQAQQEGRPSYQVPSVAINQDTPFVGLLAKVFSPEQEAELRINPLAFLMPFGGSNLGGAAEGDKAQTNYQKVMDIAGIAGLSANPIVQSAAYIHGDDFRAPSPLSRYNAIDQLGNELGVNAEAPSLLHGTLRAARKAVTGKQDTSDPVRSKAMELIFEQTGLPAADKRNAALAVQLNDPNSPLMKEAERVLDTTGATRALFNAGSPVSAMVNTKTTQEKRQASQGIPFTYDEIQQVKAVAPGVATQMQQLNNQYLSENPAAAVTQKPQLSNRDLLIAQGAAKRKLLQQSLGVK